ncbi:MAG TPA: hypothetical protein VFX95_03900 [Caulobacteraceae bacterium]|nr:hypothetical protein [Caulobacteraceae bacterium]
MDLSTILLIAGLMGAAAALYTSIGHGGASAYLAIMALFSVSAATMKPTALVLNLIAASLTTVQFMRAGQFNPKLFWMFAIPAIPMASSAAGSPCRRTSTAPCSAPCSGRRRQGCCGQDRCPACSR